MRFSLTAWTSALGFALGGFFDGIMLHQILQWHHLLSLVPGVESLRAQVLWDGVFHAAMYLIAALSLAALWRLHRKGASFPARSAAACILTGFGLWHIVDALLSHWLLGIHRIRVDSPTPLLWDLLWLVGFGIVPMVLAFRLGRGGLPPRRMITTVGLAGLAALTLAAGVFALAPARTQGLATIVFRPGVSPAEVIGALERIDARLVWSDPAMSVVTIAGGDDRWALYRAGALLVSGTLPAGCLDWSRV